MNVPPVACFLEVVAKAESAAIQSFAKFQVQSRLEKGNLATGEHLDLAQVYVDAKHVKPEERHADSMRGAEVARSDDRKPRFRSRVLGRDYKRSFCVFGHGGTLSSCAVRVTSPMKI